MRASSVLPCRRASLCPGQDVPVDVDGDGLSTYGDVYVFNYWLGLGGDLGAALSGAEVGKDGIIDVFKFFSSSAAELKPRSTAEVVSAEETGTATTASSSASILTPCNAPAGTTCTTYGRLLGNFGLSPSSPPTSVTCHAELKSPMGTDIDQLQGLWFARGPSTEANGVALLDLSQGPPLNSDGSIPIAYTIVTTSAGFGAEDVVVRENPIMDLCPYGGAPPSSNPFIHAMSTWEVDIPNHNPPLTGQLICPTVRSSDNCVGAGCGSCKLIDAKAPFAIDAFRTGMPPFGNPSAEAEDLIFSAKESGVVSIRRVRTTRPTPYPPPPNVGCYDLMHTETMLTTLSGVVKVWGLALGDFKGAGVFGAYFVSEPTSGDRSVKRLVWNQSTSTFSVQAFCTLPAGNLARSLAFDPTSGDLFVSEDRAYNASTGDAHIWRINASGTRVPFGEKFNKPNGLTFHPSGVLLVSEAAATDSTKGNVLAVGGWRYTFKRGDANGSGAVDISDPVAISNWLNHSAGAPACLDGADANDDSFVNATDRDYILDYLFSGGPPPAAPGPTTAGRDPTADLLDCTKSCSACLITY